MYIPRNSYAPQLAAITAKLRAYAKKTGAEVLFAITSPMMADLSADNGVAELNRRVRFDTNFHCFTTF